MGFCPDCPDREACFQGMSCDLSKRFAAAALVYQNIHQNTKGPEMSNAKKVTPADVAAQAADEKLVVPAQGAESSVEITPEGVGPVDEQNNADKDASETLTLLEGGKKSLKERFTKVSAKAKEHKKALIGTVAVVGAAAFVAVKALKKQVLEETTIEQVEPELIVEEQASEDSAA